MLPQRSQTKSPLDRSKLPRHIAIIMDGNGRWAQVRGLPRIEGHREGVKSVREIVEACGELGIEVLTLYTFSTENWRRPRSEVNALMRLLVATTGREVANLKKNNVRLRVIGNLDELSEAPRKALLSATQKTETNTGLILNLAVSYGGRQEILTAVRSLLKAGRTEVSEKEFSDFLYTRGLPDPDLLIRTSGEMRISNFLLWQLAYSEIVVTDTLWPDFKRAHLEAALREYALRSRRFGALTGQNK